MKKEFNKEFLMTTEDNRGCKNSTECWIWNNDYARNGVKVRDDCHFSVIFGSLHRYCNIQVKLNFKLPIGSHNLKYGDSYLIMQEISKIIIVWKNITTFFKRRVSIILFQIN